MFGRGAGFIRNDRMLVEGKPDTVVAFYDSLTQRSRGTAHTVQLARTARFMIPVWEVFVGNHLASLKDTLEYQLWKEEE